MIDSYSEKGVEGMSKELNISQARVRVLASELNLKRDYQYTEEEESEIIGLYLQGMTAQEIAEITGRTCPAIFNKLYRKGINNPENTASRYYITAPERYLIKYLSKELNISLPDKSDPNNRDYYWNIVDKYEIDIPIYIGNYKIAVEYDGERWHNEEADLIKTKRLQEEGFIVIRVKSSDHQNNYYDLKTLNPTLKKVVKQIKELTTGSL